MVKSLTPAQIHTFWALCESLEVLGNKGEYSTISRRWEITEPKYKSLRDGILFYSRGHGWRVRKKPHWREVFTDRFGMSWYKLIIFDVDGTLADRETSAVLPGVSQWFKQNPQQIVALATNQGGVGLRYWMERDGFGEPEAYPTEEAVTDHLNRVKQALGIDAPTYVCYAYQAKSGLWAPTPTGMETDPRWRQDWRKPAPGMLLAAIEAVGCTASEALMVGDSEEDKLAAEAAGCAFEWSHVFFRAYVLKSKFNSR
jgi:HAD superfamily hydrolase (TIGR01662 family)